MRILVLRVCRRPGYRASNQPLRRLRTIHTRDKGPAANVSTPTDDIGSGAVAAGDEGRSDVTLITRLGSNGQNDINGCRIGRVDSLA